MQVCSHLQAVAKSCSIWVVPIVGGIAAAKQERMLKAHPEIVVATPGRLWELMREGDPHLSNMSALSFLVLDEADRMVQQGHFEVTQLNKLYSMAMQWLQHCLSSRGSDFNRSACMVICIHWIA